MLPKVAWQRAMVSWYGMEHVLGADDRTEHNFDNGDLQTGTFTSSHVILCL